MANDYSSVAFWYQEGVNQKLRPLPPLTKRKVNFNFEQDNPTPAEKPDSK